MARGNAASSSASSATKKKQARKAAAVAARKEVAHDDGDGDEVGQDVQVESAQELQGPSLLPAQNEIVKESQMAKDTAEPIHGLPEAISSVQTDDAPSPRRHVNESRQHHAPSSKDTHKPNTSHKISSQTGPKERNGASTTTQKKKQSKKHKKGEAPPPPRKKQYIPPPKHENTNIDPIDLYGLGTSNSGYSPISPEKIVSLRLLNKKDVASIERGLEDILTWLRQLDDDPDGVLLAEVIESLPVLVHHAARLSSHSSRKVRLQNATIWSDLLTKGSSASVGAVVSKIAEPALWEQPDFLPSLLLASYDADKSIRTTSSNTWSSLCDQIDIHDKVPHLVDSLERIIVERTEIGITTDLAEAEERDSNAIRLAAAFGAFDGLLATASEDHFHLFHTVLHDDAVYSLLQPATCQIAAVRRSVWRLVQSIASLNQSHPKFEIPLDVLSKPVFTAAFAEYDYSTQIVLWNTLLPLLQVFPHLWRLYDDVDEMFVAEQDASQIAGDDVLGTIQVVTSDTSTGQKGRPVSGGSEALSHFCDLLRTGFKGNAILGYPLVRPILSTIPHEIMEITEQNLQTIFEALWKGYTDQTFIGAGPAGTLAFVSCIVEMVVAHWADHSHLHGLLSRQIHRVWRFHLEQEGLARRSAAMSMSTTQICQLVVNGLNQINAIGRPALEITLWPGVARETQNAVSGKDSRLALVARALQVLVQNSHDGLAALVLSLERACCQIILRSGLDNVKAAFLVNILELDGRQILDDTATVHTFEDCAKTISLDQIDFLSIYLRYRGLQEPFDNNVLLRLKQDLAANVRSNGLPSLALAMKPIRQAICHGVESLRWNLDEDILSHASSFFREVPTKFEPIIDVLLSLVNPPVSLLSSPGIDRLLNVVVDELRAASHTVLSGTGVYQISTADLATKIQAITIFIDRCPQNLLRDLKPSEPLLLTLFDVAILIPIAQPPLLRACDVASRLLQGVIAHDPHSDAKTNSAIIAVHLGEYVVDPRCRLDPYQLAGCLSHLPVSGVNDVWVAFLPPQDTLANLSAEFYDISPSEDLVIMIEEDPNLLLANATDTKVLQALAILQRTLCAWVAYLSYVKTPGKQHIWLLEYLLLPQACISCTESPITTVYRSSQEDMVAAAAVFQRLTMRLLQIASMDIKDKWHADATTALRETVSLDDPVIQLMVRIFQNLSPGTARSVVAVRLLDGLLQRAGLDLISADQWTTLARSWRDKNHAKSVTLMRGIRDHVHHTNLFQRYYAETSSLLSTIKAEDVNTAGLHLLEQMVVAVCPSQTEQQSMTPQRAVFTLQTMQSWADKCDDLSENAQSTMLHAMASFIDVVQNVHGKHWEFMMDLTEASIENFAWANASSHYGFWAACNFIQELQRCMASNRDLRNFLQSSYKGIIRLLQIAFLSAWDDPTQTPATPLLVSGLCRCLASAPGSFPPSQLPKLFKLCRLITNRFAWHVCFEFTTKSARDLTEQLIVQITVDSSVSEVSIRSIDQVLDNLALAGFDVVKPSTHALEAYLMAWTAFFALYQDCTHSIKTAYTERVRHSGLLTRELLPTIFTLAGLPGPVNLTSLSCWDSDSLDLASRDYNESVPLAILAGHTYNLCLSHVPALVRNAWEACKDKQLSGAILNWTATNFSPSFIKRQFASISESDGDRRIEDDSTVVKLLPNVNEIKVTYTVDEQPMELSIRFPPEFPLSPAEVRESKKLGIQESTWRAWMMNVQLVMSVQGGSVADALFLFKANAAKHFDGVEACAICYSVISVTDRSLPSKQCRTCKNAFHPACLYKWFATSHSSSCPLCRQLF